MKLLLVPLGQLAISLGLIFGAATFAMAAEFPLKDGDTWVMVGDSITAQHLHSNYFEAFCYARYPQMTFRFRNSGVGGDTIPRVMARFDWDVAPWKPTVVSVELGMNDQGGFTNEQFTANMKELVVRIRGESARPVLFSPSPINNGNTNAKLGGNTKLHQFTVSLKELAGEQNVPFADQFHAVIDTWGKNKPRENTYNALVLLRNLPIDDDLAGGEHLKAFLAAQEKSPQLVSMQGDPVHPGPCGQLTMAAALLKELGAEGFVSSASLDAKGKVVEAKGCKITAVEVSGDGLKFDRADDSLPFPIPDEARPVLPLFPTILDLSKYTLKVSGLAASHYDLTVNGTPVATLSAKDLEAGVNLTAYAKGPIADQGKAVLAAVNAKEQLVGTWRNLSRGAHAPEGTADAKARLADVAKQVDAADAKIREAAKPQVWHVELSPAK